MPTNGQTLEIPKKYADLGVKRGFRHTTPNNLRIILEKLPGHGGTEFIMSMPRTLILDSDLAANDALAQRAFRKPIKTWADYMAVKELLIADGKLGPRSRFVDHVGFDTVDSFLRVLDVELLKPVNAKRATDRKPLHKSITEFGEKGAGYAKLTNAFLREIWDLERAGYAFVLCCHLRQRMVDGNIERRCVMPPSTMEYLVGCCDVKMRIRRVYENVKTTTMKPKPSLDGKTTKMVEVPDAKLKVVSKHLLSVMPADATDLNDDTKRRIPMFQGEIEIPLIHGYDVFEKAYNEAAAAAAKLETNHE